MRPAREAPPSVQVDAGEDRLEEEDVQYLVGWGNRLGTVYTWARALYLSKNRGHRIISFQTAGYEVAGQRSFTRSIQPYAAPDPKTPSHRPRATRSDPLRHRWRRNRARLLVQPCLAATAATRAVRIASTGPG